jgi:probable rRNA maturation factor
LKVSFSCLDIQENFRYQKKILEIVKKITDTENKKLGEINYVFTSNEKILEINKKFLRHDYYTDVITFNNNKKSTIGGDIFISTEQILINSEKFDSSYQQELIRVMIHGILHLIGYNDKTESEKVVMRKKEDAYLCLFNQGQEKSE